MRKLYIVHSNKKDFVLLMDEVRIVSNTKANDYNSVIEKSVGLFVKDNSFPYVDSKKKNRLLKMIVKEAIRYNDVFFNILTSWIALWSDNNSKVFVRVTDTKIINKLKIKYKRSKYITVCITGNRTLLSSKFDIVIYNRDASLFKKELVKFAKTRLYSLQFINTPKLKH